jgi:hypothetical protein
MIAECKVEDFEALAHTRRVHAEKTVLPFRPCAWR